MSSFRRENMNHIRDKFSEKTGVLLTTKKPVRRSLRAVVILIAALVCCLTMSAFAMNLFSSLDGDDLNLKATYEGNGIVSVLVENNSDKELRFQENLKLMRWSTSEEIQPRSGPVLFEGTKIAAHSSGVMTLDLSQAYDITSLEEPLPDDYYYFVLTNNHFVFGQDWMCSVAFSKPLPAAPQPISPPAEIDHTILADVEENLRFYFENVSFEIGQRRAMDAAYTEAYLELFSKFEGNIVPSVSPLLLVDDPAPEVILDDSVPADEQYSLIGEHWKTHDANFGYSNDLRNRNSSFRIALHNSRGGSRRSCRNCQQRQTPHCIFA